MDKNNTSGLGKHRKAPLIAIFTNHNVNGEKAGRNDCQNQSITYNLDDGMAWTKYAANPVLKIIELLYYYRIKFHIAVSVVNII